MLHAWFHYLGVMRYNISKHASLGRNVCAQLVDVCLSDVCVLSKTIVCKFFITIKLRLIPKQYECGYFYPSCVFWFLSCRIYQENTTELTSMYCWKICDRNFISSLHLLMFGSREKLNTYACVIWKECLSTVVFIYI
jgi:hypothetical protein